MKNEKKRDTTKKTKTKYVYSEGGGLIRDVHSNLQRCVNNLSKCYLYVNEFHQLSVAQQEFKSLTLLLQTLCTQFPQVHVILSSIITTKDDGEHDIVLSNI